MIGSGMVPEADMRIELSDVSSTRDKKLHEILLKELSISKRQQKIAANKMSMGFLKQSILSVIGKVAELPS